MISIIMEYNTDENRRHSYKFIRYAGLDNRQDLGKKKRKSDAAHIRDLKKYIQAMTIDRDYTKPIKKYIPVNERASITDEVKDLVDDISNVEKKKAEWAGKKISQWWNKETPTSMNTGEQLTADVARNKKEKTKGTSIPERVKSQLQQKGILSKDSATILHPQDKEIGWHSKAVVTLPTKRDPL